MRQLNHRVEEQGGSFERVARDFLRSEGLLEGGEEQVALTSSRDEGFLTFMWSRRSETLQLVGDHLWLTAIAIMLAIAALIEGFISPSALPLFIKILISGFSILFLVSYLGIYSCRVGRSQGQVYPTKERVVAAG